MKRAFKKLASEWNPSDIMVEGHYGHGTSVFRNVDTRILLPAAFVIIVALAAAKRWYVPGIVFVAAFCATMYSASSRRSYLKLLAYPLLVALFIFVVQAYTFGSTVALTVIWPVYSEGIASGWLIFSRVLASVSILLLLIESKSQIELIEALRWFKVPIEIRNMMWLMLRYVSVLSEEFTTMFNAQKSRLGYSAKLNWLQKMKNLAIIGGMLLVRSYDRSSRVFRSMIARGYTQNAEIAREFARFSKKDYLFAASSCLIIACIVLLGVL